MDGIREDWTNIFDPRSYSPVDPTAGSQGNERPAEQASGGSFMGGLVGQFLPGDLGRGIAQEGLSGMLDPAGVMDRQRAQRELQAQFNIVPDGTPGVRSENQVSEEQFREIARQYSDIRMGRSDLQFDLPAGTDPADAQRYREGAMQDIGRIMQTESGRDLIGQLGNNTAPDGTHRITRIGGNDPDPQNAHAHGNPGDVGTPDHPGAGGDSRVTYNPGSTWVPQPGATHGEPWMPMRSDVQLFHELTHSLHQTHGTLASGNVTQQDLDDAGVSATDPARRDINREDRAEHQAVGIGAYGNSSISENEYRRARQRIAGLGGPGIVDGEGGDRGMRLRETYGEHGLGDPIPAP